MLAIDDERVIEPGTWRYVGLRMKDWNLWNVPVAARSAAVLEQHFRGNCYRLGKIQTRNVIVVEFDPIRLIYVRPLFRRYRAAALRTFPPSTWSIVIDHVLGRAIAHSWEYEYVLLQRLLNASINSEHALCERVLAPLSVHPDLCFWDARLRNKPLNRGPAHWGYEPPDYDPNVESGAAMTLKQRGRWGWALGTEDVLEPHPDLTPVTFA
ncbi:hypothetical protein EHH54_13025 [Rhizobium leguminosarum]|uniref:hypothetical protein n=1 Tax=Rhizobium leguminosarum TaxID=384 RepID=UPI000FEC928D|nr:hypothetical protein [Rhizobium leguminosarum]RWX40255.1 hypothetical protein EHH54_13025 [Rhizobium leguminosarum]